MNEDKICPINQVRIRIPRKLLIKLFYAKRYLTVEETSKIGRKMAEIEKVILYLEHVHSVVGKIMLKATYTR